MAQIEKADETISLQEQYPAVELAYPIALASYETVSKRADALDSRAQTLITFFSTITMAFPAITAGKGLSFRSPWFLGGMILFAVANAFGLLARLRGRLIVLDPKNIFDHYLTDNDWEFKKNTIFFAGENFQHNNKLILRRAFYLNLSCLFFAVEALALAAWAAGF